MQGRRGDLWPRPCREPWGDSELRVGGSGSAPTLCRSSGSCGEGAQWLSMGGQLSGCDRSLKLGDCVSEKGDVPELHKG